MIDVKSIALIKELGCSVVLLFVGAACLLPFYTDCESHACWLVHYRGVHPNVVVF